MSNKIKIEIEFDLDNNTSTAILLNTESKSILWMDDPTELFPLLVEINSLTDFITKLYNDNGGNLKNKNGFSIKFNTSNGKIDIVNSYSDGEIYKTQIDKNEMGEYYDNLVDELDIKNNEL